MNDNGPQCFAELSRLCLESSDVSRLGAIRNDVELAARELSDRIAQGKTDLEYARSDIERGCIVMGDSNQRPVNEHDRQVVEREEAELERQEQLAGQLPAFVHAIDRIGWCYGEMFNSDWKLDLPEAYGDNQARQAFQMRPHEKHGHVECWQNDKRSVGEVLCTAAEDFASMVTTLNEALRVVGLSVEDDRDQKVMTALQAISQKAKECQQRFKPGVEWP